MSEKRNVTFAELTTEIRRKRSIRHVGYRVCVYAFLPTQGNRGFNTMALAEVTRAEFLRVAASLLLRGLEDQGARIELTVPTADFENFIV